MDMRKKCILQRLELRLPRGKMRTVSTIRVGKETDYKMQNDSEKSLLFEPGTQAFNLNSKTVGHNLKSINR